MGRYAGRVDFVNENFGESKLADRFGIKRYPAIFINDVLVAKPKDFGFYGDGGSQGEGRYVPWRDAANHQRFQDDLIRMIDLALAGDQEQLRAERNAGASEGDDDALLALPRFSLTDTQGRTLSQGDLEGRPAIVEFWASWCPPCRGTLDFLDQLAERHGDEVAIAALAVESPEDEVRAMIDGRESGVRWAMGSPEVAALFGDVVAVPTMIVFDARGQVADVFYGAPDDLHERAEAALNTLLNSGPVR